MSWSCPVCDGTSGAPNVWTAASELVDATTCGRARISSASTSGAHAALRRLRSRQPRAASAKPRCCRSRMRTRPTRSRCAKKQARSKRPDARSPTSSSSYNQGAFVDLGCWTGSLLVGARERGWDIVGIEPSNVGIRAGARPRTRRAQQPSGAKHDLHPERSDSSPCATCSSISRPGRRSRRDGTPARTRRRVAAHGARCRKPTGASDAAGGGGRCLPMHVQYFTRSSLRRLLEAHGYQVVLVRTHAKVFSARYYAGTSRRLLLAARTSRPGCVARG